MLTLRINWNTDPDIEFPLYSVYSATKYTVSAFNDRPGLSLHLDDEKAYGPILLNKGTKVYVMNSHGATVDTIIA